MSVYLFLHGKETSAAAVLGWKVLRVTGGMLDGDALGFLELLVQALGENCRELRGLGR